MFANAEWSSDDGNRDNDAVDDRQYAVPRYDYEEQKKKYIYIYVLKTV